MVEDSSRRLFAEAAAGASLKLLKVETLVAADEEAHLLVLVQLLYAEHELVIVFERVEETAIVPCGIVATADMHPHNKVGRLAHLADQCLRLVGNLQLWTIYMLQLLLGLLNIPYIVTRVPSLGASKEFENLVHALAMRGFPCKSLVVIPSVASFQIPFMP